MNILVTGATGFIGSHVCSTLSKAGHSVAAFSRSASTAQSRVPAIARVFRWDPSSGPAPREAFDGIDAVVHLAGETLQGRWTAAKKQAIRDSRVVGTRNLVQAMAALPSRPKMLISASAVGYYGDRGDETLTEESSSGNGFLADVCIEWEREAVAARSAGMRVVCLRSGVVLGRDGGAIKAMLPLCKLGLGGPLGTGRQWWSWIHVDDEAQFVLHALTHDMDGAFNLTAPNPVRQRDLARTMGKVLKRPAVLPAPAFALNMALGEVASELLFSRRALPKRASDAGYPFRFGAVEPALQHLLAPHP